MPGSSIIVILTAFCTAAISCGAEGEATTVGSRLDQPILVLHYSPDQRYFVAWLEAPAPPPLGTLRSILLRSTTDPHDIFSFVSSPGWTRAAWNPYSTRCVIGDAPDNGGLVVWLVYQRNAADWASRKLDPFAPLSEIFYKSHPDATKLFRPSILKMEWLSGSVVRFRGCCNTGTYWITLDTARPETQANVEKISDECFDE